MRLGYQVHARRRQTFAAEVMAFVPHQRFRLTQKIGK
jgi:hypothetical protein